VEAADCGGPGGAITEDQRGEARPQGENCDIGAVEVFDEAVAPPPPTEPPGPIAGGPSFTG
jgi:hypothetical protein